MKSIIIVIFTFCLSLFYGCKNRVDDKATNYDSIHFAELFYYEKFLGEIRIDEESKLMTKYFLLKTHFNVLSDLERKELFVKDENKNFNYNKVFNFNNLSECKLFFNKEYINDLSLFIKPFIDKYMYEYELLCLDGIKEKSLEKKESILLKREKGEGYNIFDLKVLEKDLDSIDSRINICNDNIDYNIKNYGNRIELLTDLKYADIYNF